MDSKMTLNREYCFPNCKKSNQLFISGGDNFHEISYDDVIVLIHNFFANGHI